MNFVELLDVAVEVPEAGTALLRFTAREEFYNPLGVLHGGVTASLVDMAGAAAIKGGLGPNASLATVELKVNYFAPIKAGPVLARGTVLHRGRITQVAEVAVEQEGKLMAKGIATYCLVDQHFVPVLQV